MKNLSLLLGLMSLLVVAQEPVAHAGQAMQPNVAQPPLRADCTAVQVAFKICRAPAPVVGGKQPATTQSVGQSQKQPVVAFPVAPVAAAPAVQQEFVPCQGVAPIVIETDTPQVMGAALRNAFRRLPAKHNDKYQLCFSIDTPIQLSSSLIFNQQLDREVVISGLKLTKAANFQEPLLDISSQQPVTIIDGNFTNVTNGIRLSGAPHTLDHVAVSGDSAGECVIAEPEGAIIKNSTIDHCRIGLHVKAHNVALIAGSRVTQNGTGVYVDQGMLGFDVRDSFVFANSNALHFDDASRREIFQFSQKSISGGDSSPVDEQEDISISVGKDLVLSPRNAQMNVSDLNVSALISDNAYCQLPIELKLQNQGCAYLIDEIQVQKNLQTNSITVHLDERHENKRVIFYVSDRLGAYAYTRSAVLNSPVVNIGGVNPIIVPAPVAAAGDAGGEAAPADPLSGPAAEGEAEEEVQVAFGGPNGADVGGPDVGPGGDLGGGNMGGAGGSAGDEVISAKDGAAESNSGHSGDKVAFGGDSDAVQVADGGFVTSGGSGASGGCSLNTETTSTSLLSGILFLAALALAQARRKLQKI